MEESREQFLGPVVKSESEPEVEAGPLDFDDAYDEAMLLKAHIEQSREGMGTWTKENSPITAEHYSAALAAVEDLKRAVEEEGDAKASAYQIGRAINTLSRIATGPFIVLDSLFYYPTAALAASQGVPVDNRGPVTNAVLGMHRTIDELLTDAAVKLKRLQNVANKM